MARGLFIELNSFSYLAIGTSELSAPLTVDSMAEFPMQGGEAAVRDFVESHGGGKSARFHPGHCCLYPESRFFRRHTIESAAKAKDPSYFSNLLSEQFRIDPTANLAAVINASDGSEFTLEKPVTAQKELFVCGAGKRELQVAQDQLVSLSIYPESIQLGTVSILGGLIDYARFKGMQNPTLALELTPDSSNLFIVSGGRIDLCRPVPYGLNAMFPLIQQELGLKDVESARKLFYSNTFDFTEMGPVLLRKLLKELQASTGFYEVQTGQTIGQIFLALLPKNLKWIEEVLSRSLGVGVLQIEFGEWLEARGVKPGSSVQLSSLESRWLGVASLMINFSSTTDGDRTK